MSSDFVINHFIQFHLDCIPRGFDWSQCSVAEANQDELENTHSRASHRSNGKMDVNFNIADYSTNMTGLQEEADAKRELQKGGLVFGEPKHTQATYQGKYLKTHNTLGQFENDTDFEKSHRAYAPPDDVDEFIEDLMMAREEGITYIRGRYTTLGTFCKEQFIGADQWEERVLVPECDEHLPHVRWRSEAELDAVAGEKMVAVQRRVRDKQTHPDGFTIVNGTNCDAIPLPHEYVSPESLIVPKKEEASLRKIEKEMKEKAAALDPEITLVSGVCNEGGGPADGGAEATLLSKLAALKQKAHQFRQQQRLLVPGLADNHKKRKKVLPFGMDSETTINAKAAMAGSIVRCADGTYESADQIIARYQRKERIDRERRRRFIKARITGFASVLQAGHDITLGTCMAIKWGKDGTFAIVRVYKMFDEKGERAWSAKLNRKCKKAQFRVELLVPVGETQLGSQRYRSSGWNLGPIGGAMVIELIDLLPISSLIGLDRESRLHDAVLPLEAVQKLEGKGLRQIVVDENGELDVLSNDPEAKRTSGWSMGDRCYVCKILWFDHKTGALAKCNKCTRVFHQDCATPVIKNDQVDEFECSVCCGDDAEICTLL
jgi:hypothetical protein